MSSKLYRKNKPSFERALFQSAGVVNMASNSCGDCLEEARKIANYKNKFWSVTNPLVKLAA